MTKWYHFKPAKKIAPFNDMDADIQVINNKSALLMVWLKNEVLFSSVFNSYDDAVNMLKCFGCGYEYLGMNWKLIS